MICNGHHHDNQSLFTDWWKVNRQDAYCTPTTTNWMKKPTLIDCKTYCRHIKRFRLTYNEESGNCACCTRSSNVKRGQIKYIPAKFGKSQDSDVYLSEGIFLGAY